MKQLKNTVAFITGAGSGIGREIAIILARRGVHVIASDINLENANTTCAAIKALGVDSLALPLDVSDYAAFRQAAEQAIAWKGGVDILVNNAGFMVGGSVTETSMETFRALSNVNVFGVINGVKAFEGHMKEKGRGHIVNVASLFGLLHLPYVSGYAMSKAAVVGFTNAIQAELAAYNIQVTLVCPGSVSTKLVDNGQWANSKGGNFIPEMFAKHHTSTPDKIALQVVKAIEKSQPLLLAGNDAKVLGLLIRFMPGLFRASFVKLGKELAA